MHIIMGLIICKIRRFICSIVIIVAASYCQVLAQAPDIFLTKVYLAKSHDVTGWLASEKLDGVRAIWNGKTLLSRGGHPFAAPAWFLNDLPPFPLDGELWTSRGDFANIVSIVRSEQRSDDWRQIKYHVFDLPHQAGTLRARLQILAQYLAQHPTIYIQLIPQTVVRDAQHLQALLQDIVDLGGEGIIVRDPSAPYHTGRSAADLKVKQYQDAECTVLAIIPGQGKYTNMMGALRCQMPTGATFKIGSGFSDAQRAQPPLPGTVITYKYYGLTQKGIPKFASFLRIRDATVKKSKSEHTMPQ